MIFGKANAAVPKYAETSIPPHTFDIIFPHKAPYALFLADDKRFLKHQKLIVKSFPSDKEIWSMPINTLISGVYPLDFGVIVTKGKNSILYDYASGKKIHKMKGIPAYIDTVRKILVGYQGEGNSTLVGYDLTSGKRLWKTKVGNNFGYNWDTVVPLDSNTAIYEGGDLWKLNIHTGQCERFKVKRHIFDKAANAGTAALGVLSAFVGGAFMYSPSYFSDLGSNVLTEEDGRLYVADRDALTCVDTTLNVVWRTLLPENTGSKSMIRLSGDTIEMLNLGQAMTGARTRNLGDAFIATFNKNTGEQYDLLTLNKEWDKDEYSNELHFISRPPYLYDNDSEKIVPIDYSPGTFPILTTAGDVSIVDHTLKEVSRYPYGDIFYKLDDLPQGEAFYRVITADTPEIYVIDGEGKITDSMKGTFPMTRLHDGHLVTIYDGSLVIYE